MWNKLAIRSEKLVFLGGHFPLRSRRLICESTEVQNSVKYHPVELVDPSNTMMEGVLPCSFHTNIYLPDQTRVWF